MLRFILLVADFIRRRDDIELGEATKLQMTITGTMREFVVINRTRVFHLTC